MIRYLPFLFLFFSLSITGQTADEIWEQAQSFNIDSLKRLIDEGQINLIDSSGYKTGPWVTFYPYGELHEICENILVFTYPSMSSIIPSGMTLKDLRQPEYYCEGNRWVFYLNGRFNFFQQNVILEKYEGREFPIHIKDMREHPMKRIQSFSFYEGGQLGSSYQNNKIERYYKNGQLKHSSDAKTLMSFDDEGKILIHERLKNDMREERVFSYKKVNREKQLGVIPVNQLHPDLQFVTIKRDSCTKYVHFYPRWLLMDSCAFVDPKKEYFSDTTFMIELSKPTFQFDGRFKKTIQDSIWIKNHQEVDLVVKDIEVPDGLNMINLDEIIVAGDSSLVVLEKNIKSTTQNLNVENYLIIHFENADKIILGATTYDWHIHSADFKEENFKEIEMPLLDNILYNREGTEALLEIAPYTTSMGLIDPNIIKRFALTEKINEIDLSELDEDKYFFKITNYTNNTIKFAVILGVRD